MATSKCSFGEVCNTLEVYGYNFQRNKNFACKNSIAGDYLATVTYLTLLTKN
jgi:hypothetical protein